MEGYEHSDLRICRHNLQREYCRGCLFEVLCNLEDQKAKCSDTVKIDDSISKDW